jgi:16S rRNA (cytidine1402-2'-O)-methyltransferase
MSTLYVTATPIGNLEDITFRAIRILKEVDLVLCEDTRVTQKLLNHYDIDTPTMSYHSHSKLSKVEKISELLKEGKNLALVSDAGMPTISDPGVQLVSYLKEELPETDIVTIPGSSAVVSALSISGIPSSEFLFLGFLPHKKGRKTLFKEIAEEKRTVVFYESPHRILKALVSLNEHCPDKKVVVTKELTKIHEQVIEGKPKEILEYFDANPDKVRGEFVVIVA